MSYLNFKQRIKVALHVLKCGVASFHIELKGLSVSKRCFDGFIIHCNECNKTVIDYDYKKPLFYND